MKIIKNFIIALLLIGCNQAYSQALTFHDPSLQNPLVEINENLTEGIISFQFVQQLSDYENRSAEQPVRIGLSLLNIKPKDGVYSIKGSYAQNFDWQYDEEMNALLATQKNRLVKDEIGEIEMEYVFINTPSCEENKQVGFNVNIQPAACMNGMNEIENDNVSSFTCQPAFTTSLEKLDIATYKIFPNPTAESINIQLNQKPQELTIEILNVQGKIVKQYFFEQSNFEKIDVRQLPAGTYSLNITTSEKFANEKIIIIR